LPQDVGNVEAQASEAAVVPAQMIAMSPSAMTQGHPPQQQWSTTDAISKPDIVNLVHQLPKHPTNRYASRSLDQITHIAIHHSATSASVTAQRIAHYQVFSEKHQWPGMSYHYFIHPDGVICHTQALELNSNHIFGHDRYTVGVCLAGDFDSVSPTSMQLVACGHLFAWLMQELNIEVQNIMGHKEFSLTNTSCPGIQWDTGRQWRHQLIQQVHIAQNNSAAEPPGKAFDHYLLLQRHHGTWLQDDLERAASNYIARFRPTFGFSLTNAMKARRVTIVGSALESELDEESQLRLAGCQVERIVGRDIEETKMILDRLAESGQRFLEF
jgi:N-acetylmuramoyl-L-alanine amidase